MRLLRRGSDGEISLTKDLIDDIPQYATLSHTWGPDEDEISFDDFENGKIDKTSNGYAKLQFCQKQAEKDGLEYFWIDTCCINRANLVELSEAITSMFRWYRQSAKCYVFLSDVSAATATDPDDQSEPPWHAAFCKSRWFTRGWTLQELLAPAVVEFFSRESTYLGSKKTLEATLCSITSIPLSALQGRVLSDFSVEERLKWTNGRQTKKPEDRAYCLLGIFNVSMSLRYGEGENATLRLKNKINKQVMDHTDRLKSQHKMAIVYRGGGRVTEALAMLQEVVKVREQILPPDHADRLWSEHELAITYRIHGQVDDAIALFETVLKIRRESLPEDSFDRLWTEHELAITYREKGRVSEALRMFEDVVKIRQRTLPEDHHDRLWSEHELGLTYRIHGQLKEAIAILEKVVAIRQSKLEEDDPTRLWSEHELAIAYRGDGRVKEAVALLERVVKIRKKLPADRHDRLWSEHELAIAYRVDGLQGGGDGEPTASTSSETS